MYKKLEVWGSNLYRAAVLLKKAGNCPKLPRSTVQFLHFDKAFSPFQVCILFVDS